jgi:hypothetical protein
LPVEGKGLGWVPDLPDARDHLFAAPPSTLTSLPRHVDMRPDCPAIFDQGHLGSCTANAIAGAIEFDHIKQRLPPPHPFTPLRLFIYYNERVMEHSVDSDAGAQLRDGVKSVARLGTCPESAWPYDPSKFARKPPARCYKRAATYKAISYARVMQTLTQIKGCLAAGYPIVLGFSPLGQLHERRRRPHRRGAHARPQRRARAGRPRRAGGWLRRLSAAVHHAQLGGAPPGDWTATSPCRTRT